MRHSDNTNKCIQIIKNFLLLLFVFQASVSLGQNSDSLQLAKLPTEKIYLHLDKSFYTAGEDIWYKAYLVDGDTHEPSKLSEIIYVELIDAENTILSKQTLKTSNGSASGDFQLPPQSTSGNYTIRSYTNYMRNFDKSMFFKSPIVVNAYRSTAGTVAPPTYNLSDARPDVQFFPEGGYMVNGLINAIAFKAIDAHGKGISISGKLLDDTGSTVKSFSSSHLGMGLFHFIPTKGMQYRAVITDSSQEWTYNLPTAQERGILMTVSSYKEFYKIEMRATSPELLSSLTLLGKQKGRALLRVPVNSTNGEPTGVIKLAKNILKEGVTAFALLNGNDRPIAERLLFHEKQRKGDVANISSKKDTYGQRELVNLEIDMNPELDDKNTSANLSLAVTHAAVSPMIKDNTDIKTYLLLHSEVKGEIEQPGYYFHSMDAEREKNLDLLMRTQGWRQYRLNDVVVKTKDGFLPETGIQMTGKVVSSVKPEEPVRGTVFLTSNNKEEMAQHTAKTDDMGNFRFENLDFADTTGILVSAKVAYITDGNKRKAALNYKIVLEPASSPEIGTNTSYPQHIQNLVANRRESQNLSNAFLFDTSKTVILNEAIVSGTKIEMTYEEIRASEKEANYKRKTATALYLRPSQTVDFDDIIAMPNLNPLQALQGRVAGLRVMGDYVYIRGNSSLQEANNPAMILLDGMPIDPEGFFIPPQEIDFIDILKGNTAAMFGSRGGAGVVAIYTKDGLEPSTKRKTGSSLSFEHPGYHYARTFYEPKYEATKNNTDKLDARTTLHWQPNIQLNDYGKASISFYTGDVAGDYKVSLEGITSQGTPISKTTSFKIDTSL